MLGVAELVARRLIDRHGDGVGRRVAAIAGMQHDGFGMLALCRHKNLPGGVVGRTLPWPAARRKPHLGWGSGDKWNAVLLAMRFLNNPPPQAGEGGLPHSGDRVGCER